MTIWILAVLLLASLVGLGWRQGAIRVGFSFIGILFGALLAVPLGRLVRPGLSAVGVKNDTVLWLIPPVIVFIFIGILFKVAALVVHQKVEVYYKYKAGDLRLSLWERLNHRLGLCLGFLNGVAYLILLCFIFYILGYWTVQFRPQASGADPNPKMMRLLSQLGLDLQSTGMSKVARAIDRMPAAFYQTADLAGTLYNTPLLEARVYRYPAFLGLAETPDFQNILNDKQFTEMWQRQAPVLDLVHYPAIQSVLKNPGLLNSFWNALQPNLDDLGIFLTNGVSPKYDDEKILGRWDFNVNATIGLLRKTRPNIPSNEMSRLKQFFATGYANTTLIAMMDKKLLLKNYPVIRITAGAAPTTEMQTANGQWNNDGAKYSLSYDVDGKSTTASAQVEADRIYVIPAQGLGLVFERED
jgi:hypothetical protein